MPSPSNPLAVVAAYLRALPPTIRQGITNDPAFNRRFGLTRPVFNLGPHAIPRDVLVSFLRALADGRPSPRLKDIRGQDLEASIATTSDGSAVITIASNRFVFSGIGVLTAQSTDRLAALESLVRSHTLSPSEESKWREAVTLNALNDEEYASLLGSLSQSLEGQLRRMSKNIEGKPSIDLGDLLPSPEATLAGILPLPGQATTWTEYAKVLEFEHRQLLEKRGIESALRLIGPTAILPNRGLLPGIVQLITSDLGCLAHLVEAGDPFSVALGFDICVQLVATTGDVVPIGKRAMQRLLTLESSEANLVPDFSNATLLTMGPFAERRILEGQPLYYRRLAAFTWAGYVASVFSELDFSRAEFADELQSISTRTIFSLVLDRRTAPYWQPEYLQRDGTRGLLHRRLLMSLEGYDGANIPGDWRAVLDTAQEKETGKGGAFLALTPNPLEEFSKAGSPLVEPVTETEHLLRDRRPKISPSQFLAQASPIIRAAEISEAFAADIGDAIQRIGIAAEPSDDEETVAALIGCQNASYLAGIRRDTALAERAIQAARRMTERTDGKTVLGELFVIFDAAAAFTNVAEYRAFIATHAYAFALGKIDISDAARCEDILHNLCTVDPLLRSTLSRAIAALRIAGRISDVLVGQDQGVTPIQA